MTGGQAVDGQLTVAQIAHQLAAEGVKRVAIVAETPGSHDTAGLPAGTTVSHRDDLDAVQRDLRQTEGVSVLIYDQVCATEKRRRRKRGSFGYGTHRVAERRLIADYEGDVDLVTGFLARAGSPGSLTDAVALLGIPEQIRGYGPVKERSIQAAQSERVRLRSRLAAPLAEPVS